MMNRTQQLQLKLKNKSYFAEMDALPVDEQRRRADISTITAAALIELLNSMQSEYKKSLEDFIQNYGYFYDQLNIIYNQAEGIAIETPTAFAKSFSEKQRANFILMLPVTLRRLRKVQTIADKLETDAAIAATSYLFSSKRAISAARNNTNSLCNCEQISQLQAQGYKYKQWHTVMDGRERFDHAVVNGQIVPINQPFIVGGYRMMFPKDTTYGAPISQIANCRCMITGR